MLVLFYTPQSEELHEPGIYEESPSSQDGTIDPLTGSFGITRWNVFEWEILTDWKYGWGHGVASFRCIWARNDGRTPSTLVGFTALTQVLCSHLLQYSIFAMFYAPHVLMSTQAAQNISPLSFWVCPWHRLRILQCRTDPWHLIIFELLNPEIVGFGGGKFLQGSDWKISVSLLLLKVTLLWY